MDVPRTPPGTSIVVGVTPDLQESVLLQAASLAAHLDAELVCANVDVTRYTIEEMPDGSVATFPLDPDQAEVSEEGFDPALAERIAHVLEGRGIRWRLRALAGEPAAELGRVAAELDAALIVVGTRRPGFSAGAREFFTGSVAVHLAHRQPRPVVVIPLTPTSRGPALPWALDE